MNRALASVAIIIALVFIASAGWWYLNQSSAPMTSEVTQLPVEQRSTNTSPAVTQTQPTAGTATKTYTNSEFGISFSHPSSWHCRTLSGYPSSFILHQTECNDDPNGRYIGDSLANIVVRIESGPSGEDDVTEISRTSITGQNSSVLAVVVLRSTLYPSIGWVSYQFTGSAGTKSYALAASYGTGKPYATPDDVRKVLDPIAQSLLVK